MTAFLLSFTLFIALHSIPAIPAIRQGLIGRLGRGAYFTLYSIASTGALVLLFATAFRLDYVPLWDPQPWQAWVTIATAPLGLFLVLAGLISENRLSVTLRKDRGRNGAITALTRHPVLAGFLVWALGHMVPNGDLRSVILFGGFALFSLGGIAMQERRARRRLTGDWREAAAGTSVFPSPRHLRLDSGIVIGLVLTLAVTALLLAGGHEWLVGVDPLALAEG